MKRVRNLSCQYEKGPRGLRDAFYGFEKVEKTFWSRDFLRIFKTVLLQQLKGINSSKLGVQKGSVCQ